ncbi:MAG: hypothetical protein HY868_05975 [Chloroflexi bacterium]|nr:hypothetical protein [Chloroflexota bacterium]
MQGQALFEIDGDQYGEAVALFGLAQSYKAQGKWDKVFQTYEKCQRVLSRVNSDPATVYLRQLVKERYIEAISEERKKTQATTSTVIVGTKSFSIGILPVFSQIPAGDPRSIPETETGYIETDRFIVNGKTYYVAESRSTRFRLDFSVQWTYIASRVQGDSMNKAGIDDEDYVILRIPATAGLPIIPENGDIVAVALPEDDGVTLKRYRRRGDQVIFEPDSTNPNHQSYPFKSSKESEIPAKIIGIHVATLKPL